MSSPTPLPSPCPPLLLLVDLPVCLGCMSSRPAVCVGPSLQCVFKCLSWLICPPAPLPLLSFSSFASIAFNPSVLLFLSLSLFSFLSLSFSFLSLSLLFSLSLSLSSLPSFLFASLFPLSLSLCLSLSLFFIFSISYYLGLALSEYCICCLCVSLRLTDYCISIIQLENASLFAV